MKATATAKKRYADRKAQGLCVRCGKDGNGKLLCEVCTERSRTSRRKGVVRKKAAGICQCTGCHAPAMEGKTVCKACSNRSSATGKRRYQQRKADPNETRCTYCNGDAVRNNMCQRCIDNHKTYKRKRYKQQVVNGLCTQCNKPTNDTKRLCVQCWEKRFRLSSERQQRLKLAAFDAYGGPVCAMCGFDNTAVLEIDHINGGGRQHLKTIGPGRFYFWLQQNNYPEGFRVLCPTCNKLAHIQRKQSDRSADCVGVC